MKANSRRFFMPIAMLLLGLSCVEPYAPPDISGNPDFVVIDAYLNGSDNSCHARITKAVSLSSENSYEEILDPMSVSLEDEQGNSYPLNIISNGQFEAVALPLDHSRKYRLVVTISSEVYTSTFEEIKQTPPIDRVFFEAANDGLKIFVNSAEGSGDGNYYRWSWVETWEYTSNFYSRYKQIEDDSVIPRTDDEQIYRCYRTDPSTEIMIASSTELNSDVIRNFEVRKIPRNSQKLQHRYSINVRQTALTADAYTYWLSLYKTTENVGGLFDPMPGEVIGNFTQQSDPTARVIGYFSAATMQEQRIFITGDDLPKDYKTFRPPFCELDTVLLDELGTLGPSLLVSEVYSQPGFPVLIGYNVTAVECADCRATHKGVTQKPSFWP